MSQPSPRGEPDVPSPGLPRWVKALAIAAAVAVIAFLAFHLLGGHGPTQHMMRH